MNFDEAKTMLQGYQRKAYDPIPESIKEAFRVCHANGLGPWKIQAQLLPHLSRKTVMNVMYRALPPEAPRITPPRRRPKLKPKPEFTGEQQRPGKLRSLVYRDEAQPTHCPKCSGFVVDDSVLVMNDGEDPGYLMTWRCFMCGYRPPAQKPHVWEREVQ